MQFQAKKPIGDDVSIRQLLGKAQEWFRLLRSKWLILTLAALIGGLIGFIRVYKQKVKYTGRLTFAMENDNAGGGFGSALGLASSFGFDLGSGSGGGAFSPANMVELMKSRKLIEEALLSTVKVNNTKISLAEMYININGWRNVWKKNNPVMNRQIQFNPNADRTMFTVQQDSVLGIIYDNVIEYNLTVKPIEKKVSILSLEVKSENELFSKFFAENLAKVATDFYIETISKKARYNVSILEKQADSIRAELNGAITGVAIANDNTFNLNPALNVKKTLSSRRQIDVQANIAVLTEVVKNLEIAKVTLRKETPLIQIIDTPILPLPKDKRSPLKFAIIGALLATLLCSIFLTIRQLMKVME